MPSVLIVDDELAIRDMVRMALEMDEFACLEAGSAKDAYSIIVMGDSGEPNTKSVSFIFKTEWSAAFKLGVIRNINKTINKLKFFIII